MTYRITARKTATYIAAVNRLTSREMRDYDDWTWLQNLPFGEETLRDWLASQPAETQARAALA